MPHVNKQERQETDCMYPQLFYMGKKKQIVCATCMSMGAIFKSKISLYNYHVCLVITFRVEYVMLL